MFHRCLERLDDFLTVFNGVGGFVGDVESSKKVGGQNERWETGGKVRVIPKVGIGVLVMDAWCAYTAHFRVRHSLAKMLAGDELNI